MARKSPIRRRNAAADPSDPLDKLRAAKAAEPSEAAEPSQVEERRGLVQAVRRLDRPAEPVRRTDPSERVSVDFDGLEALARMDPSQLDALMDAQPDRRRLQEGQRISGTVTRIDDQVLFLDVQLKAEATLPRTEVPAARVGDVLDVWVVWTDGQDVEVSTQLSGALAADFLDEAKAAEIPVEGIVTARNSGGFTVSVGDQSAFVPASHMDRLRSADLDSFVGQTLKFLVIETGDRAVLSRRRLQEKQLAGQTEQLWATMRPGDLHEGTITSIQAFGMFVDVDGVEGLVPKSEVTSDREADLTQDYTPGQRLAVRVLQIDPDQKRVSFRPDGVRPKARATAQRPDRPQPSAGEAGFGTMADLLQNWKK